MAEEKRKTDDIFLAARGLPAAERQAFLDRECGDDEVIRSEVESLIEADRAKSFLDSPILDQDRGESLAGYLVESLRDSGRSSSEGSPREGLEEALPHGAEGPDAVSSSNPKIGGFEILEVLGQGGMGTVFKARQSRPDRIVAVKVLQSGSLFATKQERFEREVSFLGRLDHPGICQIYDAGFESRFKVQFPYFAMEYVEGKTLTEFLRAEAPSLERRLELLREIGESVAYAHQKGVIHRDLKPSNILVDRFGRTRVVDFGIARAIEAEDDLTLTQTGQIFGSFPYLSPEQCEGRPEVVDVRTDLYSLGVIGYELLSGRPFLELRGMSQLEAIRAIRTSSPPLLGRLVPRLRGDVESIIAKATQHDPKFRYGSVREFCADLVRFRNGEPVAARPPGSIDQLRKFILRHKVFSFAVISFGVLLISAVVSITAMYLRSEGFRKREKDAAEEARANLDFLEDLITSIDPVHLGPEIPYRSVLLDAARKIEKTYTGSEEGEAEIRLLFAEALANVGDPQAAVAQLENVMITYEDLYGKTAPLTLRVRTQLAQLHNVCHRDAEAEETLRTNLSLQERLPGIDPLDLANTRLSLGLLLCNVHRGFSEARPLAKKALATYQRSLGLSAPETVGAEVLLAKIEASYRDYASAERRLQFVLEVQKEQLPPRHPHTLGTLSTLGQVLYDQGRFEEAAKSFTQCLRGRVDTLTLGHEYTRYTLSLLYDLFEAAGMTEERRQLIDEYDDLDSVDYHGRSLAPKVVLGPPHEEKGLNFGASIAVDGTTVLVGAPGWNNRTGGVFVFDHEGGRPTDSRDPEILPVADQPLRELGARTAFEGDWCFAVSLASLVAFKRDGQSWEFKQKFNDPGWMIGRAGIMMSGRHLVAIDTSKDQDTSADDPIHRISSYRYDGREWSRHGRFPSVSRSLSALTVGDLQKDTLVLSATQTEKSSVNCRAVYVFEWKKVAWKLVQTITPCELVSNAFFGLSLSLSSDARRLIVGAPETLLKESPVGAACIYRRKRGEFEHEAILVPPDGAARDRFGRFVAIEGDVAYVVSDRDDQAGMDAGSVYVFERLDEEWRHKHKLLVEGGGWKLQLGSLVLDEGAIWVGAPKFDGNHIDSGGIFRFGSE